MSAAETLTPEQRRKFLAAAERGLRPRRAILLLAAHATGHLQHPHGDWCETCKEKCPCQAVRRAASPALNAVADLTPNPPGESAAVIDPDDRADVERLARAMDDQFASRGWASQGDPDHDVLDAIQAALHTFTEETP